MQRNTVTAALPVYRMYGAEDRLVVAHPDAEHDFPPGTRKAAYEFLDKWLR